MAEQQILPILVGKNITKMFGGIVAVNDVSFELYSKEILALLGDNGAGKSTLIKVLAGVHKPDKGKLFFHGKEVAINSPREARELGIETIHQDLGLFDVLKIPANLFAGKEVRGKLGILSERKMKERSQEILEKLGIKVKSINQMVRELSGGQRHAIAIGRAVYVGKMPLIILMDEPTAGLGAKESETLLSLMKMLKESGIAIIYISHNLDHVFAVSDRAIIMRNGHLVGEKKTAETDKSEVIHMMLGVL
jgi:ABC-type sugar transport system ATPase subunit